MDNDTGPIEQPTTAPYQAQAPSEDSRRQQTVIIIAIIGVILVLVLIIASIVVLLHPATDTAKIRDVFIIYMDLQSLFLGLTIIILNIQFARMINQLQN